MLKRLFYNITAINPQFAVIELVKKHLSPWTHFVNLNNSFLWRVAEDTYVRNGLLFKAFLGHQKWVLSCPDVFKLFPANLGHLKENIKIMIICILISLLSAFEFLKMSYVLRQIPFSVPVSPWVVSPWWFWLCCWAGSLAMALRASREVLQGKCSGMK